MKIKKINLTVPNVLLILFIITMIILIHNVYFNDKKNNSLEKSGKYTIGKVEEYSPLKMFANCSTSPSLKYSYKVQGIEYYDASIYNIPNENGPEKGSLFMAIYLPNNPKKCILLLDYPVKDSSDYKKYIEQFKSNPPKLN